MESLLMTSEPPCVLPVSVMTSRRHAAVQGDTVLWFWGSGEDSLPRGTLCTVYHSSLDRWPQRRKLTRTGALGRPLCRLFVTWTCDGCLKTYFLLLLSRGSGQLGLCHHSVELQCHKSLICHSVTWSAWNTYMVLSAGSCPQRDNLEMTVCQ